MARKLAKKQDAMLELERDIAHALMLYSQQTKQVVEQVDVIPVWSSPNLGESLVLTSYWVLVREGRE
jgi:hypothetical protein